MHEARLGADMLAEVGQEGDRLVVHLALDLADALDIEPAALPHRLCHPSRDHAQLFLRLAGEGFDFELDAEIILRLPDRRHLRPAVARDHEFLSPLCAAGSSAESSMSIFAISTSSDICPDISPRAGP